VSLNISLSHSRSLNVPIGLHNNYGPNLYHFRDKVRYWSKIAIFSYPCIRRSSSGGPSLNIATRFGSEKLECSCYPKPQKKFENLFTRFSTIHECDGQQKDGQTRHDSIQPCLCKTSRHKKRSTAHYPPVLHWFGGVALICSFIFDISFTTVNILAACSLAVLRITDCLFCYFNSFMFFLKFLARAMDSAG